MATRGRIDERQNSPDCQALLRAAAVAHRHGQRVQAVSLAVSLCVAGFGLVARRISSIGPTVVVVGALWAATYAVFVVPWSGRYLRTSAIVQEMIDVSLFDLPWNWFAVGDPMSDDEVSRLSRQFHGDPRRLRDYYLVARVPAPYDVAFCLEQNLAWGSRVRRRFADVLITMVALWCGLGLLLGIVTNSTIGGLVSGWFVPSLGLLLLCLDIYRAQVSITRERTRVLGLLRAAVDESASPVFTSGESFTVFARQIQNTLFSMRARQARVPAWFFRRFHDQDLTDFRFKMQVLETRFRDEAAAAP